MQAPQEHRPAVRAAGIDTIVHSRSRTASPTRGHRARKRWKELPSGGLRVPRAAHAGRRGGLDTVPIGEHVGKADWKTEKHVPAIDCPDKVKADQMFDVKVTVGKEIAHPEHDRSSHQMDRAALDPEGAKFELPDRTRGVRGPRGVARGRGHEHDLHRGHRHGRHEDDKVARCTRWRSATSTGSAESRRRLRSSEGQLGTDLVQVVLELVPLLGPGARLQRALGRTGRSCCRSDSPRPSDAEDHVEILLGERVDQASPRWSCRTGLSSTGATPRRSHGRVQGRGSLSRTAKGRSAPARPSRRWGYPSAGAKFRVTFLSPSSGDENRSRRRRICANDHFLAGMSSSRFASSVVCIENCSWNLPPG